MGLTESIVIFAPAIARATLPAVFDTSSLIFKAACSAVCEPGLFVTLDATPRIGEPKPEGALCLQQGGTHAR